MPWVRAMVNLADERRRGGGKFISGGVDRGIHALVYYILTIAVAL